MLQTPHGIHEWRLLGLNLFLKECAFDFSSHDNTSHITLRFSILVMCLFPIIWTWTVAKQYKPTAAMQVLLIGISTIVSIVNIYIYIHTHSMFTTFFGLYPFRSLFLPALLYQSLWEIVHDLGMFGHNWDEALQSMFWFLVLTLLALYVSWIVLAGSSSRKSIFGRHHEASVVACNHNYDSSY